MSHVFDNDLATPQRTLLETGAVTILSDLARANGGYLADVIAFPGIVRAYTDEDGIQNLLKEFSRTPMIGVATATREFQTTALGGRQAISECELLLYIATQHSRSALSGRQHADVVALADDTADPGLHVVMQHALELMHGAYPQALIGTIKQIAIKREQELVTAEKITIWLQTYRVTLHSYTGGKEWKTAAQLLTEIGWRTTTDPTEVLPPDAQITPTSVDVDTDPTP